MTNTSSFASVMHSPEIDDEPKKNHEEGPKNTAGT
jgi:hypothetical protein